MLSNYSVNKVWTLRGIWPSKTPAHSGTVWIVKQYCWQTTRQNGPLQGKLKYFYLMNSSSSKFNFQQQLMVAAAGNTASSHTFCYQYTNKSQNLLQLSHIYKSWRAVTQLRQLTASFSLWESGFNPRPLVGFLLDKVPLG